MQSKFHENELRYKPPCLKFVTIKKSVIKPYWDQRYFLPFLITKTKRQTTQTLPHSIAI